jgi:DNA polymerase-3 subunit beta
MDLTLDQAGFARALRLIGRAVPSRPTLPVLQHVLLEGTPGRLTLTATDLDLAVVTSTPADVAAPGRVLLPARLLGEFVGQLPAVPLHLGLEPARRRIWAACGGFVAAFATASPDEFPALPPTEGSTTIEIDGARLRGAVDRVAFAAADDPRRPVLCGVLFDFGPDGLTLAAADGFRLARARLPEVAAEARRLLVPARAATEFGRLLGDGQPARLVVLAEGRGVRLEVGETTVFARLIEGAFPDLERIIPRECATRVRVDAGAFRQAVRVAGLFGGSGDARPVMLDAVSGRLRLRARGDQTGEAEGELPASLEGTPQPVVLNTRLLVDVLEAVPGPRLEIAWSSPRTPVLIREAENASGDRPQERVGVERLGQPGRRAEARAIPATVGSWAGPVRRAGAAAGRSGRPGGGSAGVAGVAGLRPLPHRREEPRRRLPADGPRRGGARAPEGVPADRPGAPAPAVTGPRTGVLRRPFRAPPGARLQAVARRFVTSPTATAGGPGAPADRAPGEAHQHARIRALQHLSEPPTVEGLSDRAGMGPRRAMPLAVTGPSSPTCRPTARRERALRRRRPRGRLGTRAGGAPNGAAPARPVRSPPCAGAGSPARRGSCVGRHG